MAVRVRAWRGFGVHVLALGLVSLVGCAGTGSTTAVVAGVDPQDEGLTRELQAIDAEIEILETWLASYPGRFESRADRLEAVMRWRAAIERAAVLLNVDLEHPELYARLGDLYRQGHNLDVPEAASQAFAMLSQCLLLAPDHVGCHFSLARLFLASPPQYAARAEYHLERIRSITDSNERPDVEAALARAYFAQGKRSAALRQIDHYLTLEPDDQDARRFRNELLIEVESGR